jgi:solute carrier family 5 (high affinity choline transporter), member 7
MSKQEVPENTRKATFNFSKNALNGAMLLFLSMLLLGVALHLYKGELYWGGYAAISFFYAIMFYLGLSVADDGSGSKDRLSEMMMAGRSMPLWMAVMTMTATWVGGGFVNGTVESVAGSGLAMAQAPWGYALSLIIGGLIFAVPMRRLKYATMLDPLEDRFGTQMAGLLYIPAVLGEVFWTASILVALGTTFGFILDVDFNTSIIISSLVAIMYTSAGGLRSVAITDVFQLFILIGGLYLLLFFVWPTEGLGAMYSSYQQKMGDTSGIIPPANWGIKWFPWIDAALLLILGGIPWHVYFQRVLASRTESVAMWLSIVAGVLCLLAAVPAVIMGMLYVTTDWAALGVPPLQHPSVTLPYVIRYLTPPIIAILALGALAAGVMSSVDSSILSASSMGTWNVVRPLFGLSSTDGTLITVLQRLVWIVGIAATLMALQIKSIYALWFLCSDLVYCILFAQLLTALFDKQANIFGSIAGYSVSLFLRLFAGEPALGLPPAFGLHSFGLPTSISYPWPDEQGFTQFPFRTVSMLAGLIMIIVVSRLTSKICPPRPLVPRTT